MECESERDRHASSPTSIISSSSSSSSSVSPADMMSDRAEHHQVLDAAVHSSEEELETFNCNDREKRKWSQVKRGSSESSCSSCSDTDMMSAHQQQQHQQQQRSSRARQHVCSSSSSLSPPQSSSAVAAACSSSAPLPRFCSWPPAHAHKPVLPRCAGLAATPACQQQRARGRSKRHRATATDPATAPATSSLPPRPCLDLEKMQQEAVHSVTTWKPSAELSLFCW